MCSACAPTALSLVWRLHTDVAVGVTFATVVVVGVFYILHKRKKEKNIYASRTTACYICRMGVCRDCI